MTTDTEDLKDLAGVTDPTTDIERFDRAAQIALDALDPGSDIHAHLVTVAELQLRKAVSGLHEQQVRAVLAGAAPSYYCDMLAGRRPSDSAVLRFLRSWQSYGAPPLPVAAILGLESAEEIVNEVVDTSTDVE